MLKYIEIIGGFAAFKKRYKFFYIKQRHVLYTHLPAILRIETKYLSCLHLENLATNVSKCWLAKSKSEIANRISIRMPISVAHGSISQSWPTCCLNVSPTIIYKQWCERPMSIGMINDATYSTPVHDTGMQMCRHQELPKLTGEDTSCCFVQVLI